MRIYLLQRDGIANLFHSFSGAPYNKTLEVFQEYYTEQQKGEREVYIASENDDIIGYITLVWHSPYPPFAKLRIPEIKDLNIRVEYRRKGYAKSLLHHCEERARSAGYTTIGIGVGTTPDYDPARQLYAALNYIPDGRGVFPDAWGGATYFTKRLVAI